VYLISKLLKYNGVSFIKIRKQAYHNLMLCSVSLWNVKACIQSGPGMASPQHALVAHHCHYLNSRLQITTSHDHSLCFWETRNLHDCNWWGRTISESHSISLDCPFNCSYSFGYIMTCVERHTFNRRVIRSGWGGRLAWKSCYVDYSVSAF
jgi:hypothetical protein